ncbi:MAG: hypothetical protein GY839_08850 [candidate division Zixibacteria bacterium]|nr:hypothetical protein [candidate division Zixibacteria bacterium]
MNSTENSLFNRITKWVSLGFALVFIAIGIGILAELILPGPRLLNSGSRAAVGGFILAYGIARMIMIYVRSRRAKKADKTFHSE